MFVPTYLCRSKYGIFYFRWPIPRQLHPQNQSSTIKLSLQTRDPKNALRLARRLIQIGEIGNGHGIARNMQYYELRALLTKHFKGQLEKRKAEIDVSGRLSANTRHEIERYRSSIIEAKTSGTSLSPIDDDELLRRFVAKFELDVVPGSKQYEWLRTEIANSYVSYLRALVDYDESLDSYDLTTTVALPHALGRSDDRQEGLSIARVALDYRADKQIGDNWAARTKLEKADHIKLLEEILGTETDIRSLTVLDAKKVKDTLRKYPKNRFKKPETKNLTLAELAQMEGIDRIQVPTINKYLQTFNDLFEWAYRQGLIDSNLFSGSSIRQKRRGKQEKRDQFSGEQINLLLQTIIEDPQNLIRKHYQKWGPLIGLYTGARLNEIAQLELTDIRQDDGIWIFDLTNEDDAKQLKSVAARRRVPIHQQLIKLGLLETVDKLRKDKKRYLFPDLTDSVQHGRGRNLGRWFNEKLLPKLGIKRTELVFHSLRHTVITRLYQADVPEPVLKELVGHAQVGVTQQSYNKGYSIHQLNDAMQKLQYIMD